MPGTPKNTNALKHGRKSRAVRYGLKVGALPKEFRHIQNHVNGVRREMETAVESRHGQVSLSHALLIDSAVAHELHATICRTLLNRNIAKLAPLDQAKLAGDAAKAKEARNRAFGRLDLDPSDHDPWRDVFTAPAIASDATEPTGDDSPQQPHDAHEASTGSPSGDALPTGGAADDSSSSPTAQPQDSESGGPTG